MMSCRIYANTSDEGTCLGREGHDTTTSRVPGRELVRYMLVVNIGFVVCAGAVAASSVIHIPHAFTAEQAVPGSAARSAAWHSAAGSAAK